MNSISDIQFFESMATADPKKIAYALAKYYTGQSIIATANWWKEDISYDFERKTKKLEDVCETLARFYAVEKTKPEDMVVSIGEDSDSDDDADLAQHRSIVQRHINDGHPLAYWEDKYRSLIVKVEPVTGALSFFDTVIDALKELRDEEQQKWSAKLGNLAPKPDEDKIILFDEDSQGKNSKAPTRALRMKFGLACKANLQLLSCCSQNSKLSADSDGDRSDVEKTPTDGFSAVLSSGNHLEITYPALKMPTVSSFILLVTDHGIHPCKMIHYPQWSDRYEDFVSAPYNPIALAPSSTVSLLTPKHVVFDKNVRIRAESNYFVTIAKSADLVNSYARIQRAVERKTGSYSAQSHQGYEIGRLTIN